MDFNTFRDRAISKALAQEPEEGLPPLGVVSRYSLMFGDVGIPVFGNYHSFDADVAEAQKLLEQWLVDRGHEVPDRTQLPVIHQIWPDGQQVNPRIRLIHGESGRDSAPVESYKDARAKAAEIIALVTRPVSANDGPKM